MIFLILLLFFIIPINTTATNVVDPQSEDRIWDGGGGDNLWMNPLNWSNDALPELDADVIIQTNVTVIYDHPSFTVESISILNNAHLIVADGAYLHTTKGAADGSDGFRLTGINADTIAKLTVYGQLDITMAFADGDGMDINKFAEVFVAEGGLLSISNPSESGIEISDKLTNAGTITITNTGDHGFYNRSAVVGGAIFNNTSTGVLLISQTGEEGIYLESNIDFTNSGLIKVSNTNGVAFDGNGHDLHNFGIFEAEGLVKSVDFVVENNSTIKIGAPGGSTMTMDDDIGFSNSTLAFHLNGNNSGITYDQLVLLQANANLSNCTLHLEGTYTPQNGDVFTILLLDAGQNVSGNFATLPEGTLLNFNGKQLLVSYIAGDGNDVALITQATIVDVDMDGYNSNVDCNDTNAAIHPGATEIANNNLDENCDGIILIIDVDMDGYNSSVDCNDTNAAIYPGATEIANNNVDENCDGIILIIDVDMDGYNSSVDCNDTNATINPGATEIANNNVDENCDGIILIIDVDTDGYNSSVDCNDTNAAINPGATEIANNNVDENCDGIILIIDVDMDGYNSSVDCNDTNAAINPGATEIANNNLDENCDGIILIIDVDMDGFNSSVDCNDTNAAIHPGATEIANNNVDENCDGIILIIDVDMDGFNSSVDCNDTNAAINPGATEIANNNVDENCDGIILIIDVDMDGFNSSVDCNDTNAAINPGATEIANNNVDENCDGIILIIDVDMDGYNSSVDCNDTNAAIHPGATEIANNNVDENCDGIILIIDVDMDGYNSSVDCNDTNAAIYPGATEIANNNVDENCDGIILIIDVDMDGFNSSVDCNDNNAGIHPGAMEIPNNGIDENCDGFDAIVDVDMDGYNSNVDCNDNNAAINPGATDIANNSVDENCDGILLIIDVDMDGYHSSVDCNDNNANVNPGATEIPYNGLDDDCNPATLDDDSDQDGYNPDVDCDDTNNMVYPEAPEICDGIDNNCNELVDEGLTFSTYYEDADGDGYGNAATAMTSCEGVPPANFVTNGLDCDDTNNTVYPEAPEICDDIDNNCNELADEGLTFTTYYEDADGDAYGNAAISMTSCEGVPPANFVANDFDCDDNNNTVYPEAPEICDDIDNNCNELADEGLTFTTYYEDADGDGYGNVATAMTSCEEFPPANFVANDVDCDDTDPNSYPGAVEIPDNGIDENCDSIDSMTTSVKTVLFSIQAAIYPNPTSGQLQVLAEAGELTLRIYDVRGALVIEHFFTEKTTVDLSNYSAGVYLIQLFGKEGLWMGKVLKD